MPNITSIKPVPTLSKHTFYDKRHFWITNIHIAYMFVIGSRCVGNMRFGEIKRIYVKLVPILLWYVQLQHHASILLNGWFVPHAWGWMVIISACWCLNTGCLFMPFTITCVLSNENNLSPTLISSIGIYVPLYIINLVVHPTQILVGGVVGVVDYLDLDNYW